MIRAITQRSKSNLGLLLGTCAGFADDRRSEESEYEGCSRRKTRFGCGIEGLDALHYRHDRLFSIIFLTDFPAADG